MNESLAVRSHTRKRPESSTSPTARVEAAHLAVDEFHVRNACSTHRRSYQGLARAGALERLGLRRRKAIQFGIDAGEAVANVAKDPEFPLARIANVRARVAAQCKARDPFRCRA